MNGSKLVIARCIAFLERELERMATVADDAEHDLRLNPSDHDARRRLEAIYVLTGETWDRLRELRADEGGCDGLIHVDRHEAIAVERSYRQALI
jgi:hypothetical protein